MKRSLILIALVVMSLAGARPVAAQDSNADARPSFDSFQVIERNNIFDPSRRPLNPHRGPPPPRVYTFSLNGTMTYENKGYAFFEGSGAGRGQAFSTSDTINGYRITEITNNTVKLGAASNQFILLKVGMQMRKVENGPWSLVASSMPVSESPSLSSAEPASDDGSGESAAPPVRVNMTPGADADIIARLMRRRAQQNGDSNAAPANGDTTQ